MGFVFGFIGIVSVISIPVAVVVLIAFSIAKKVGDRHEEYVRLRTPEPEIRLPEISMDRRLPKTW